MKQVAIIGCGVVGAAIAYELSRVSGLNITLFERQVPASGSTGAALGVLMGVISRKTQGRAWKLRQASLQRYQTLIPELESLTAQSIPTNRQGILLLCFAQEELGKWERLAEIRRRQGYQLEIWQRERLLANCPQIEDPRVIGAIYSPQDLQINPTRLTQALGAGAARNGVNCRFGVKVQNFLATDPDASNLRRCYEIQTTDGAFQVDWVVLAAGLESTSLTASLAQTVDLRPVLGQAVRVKQSQPMGNSSFQPVISGNDVHIVPLGEGEYWIGATVEFPNQRNEVFAEPELLEKVLEEGIKFCPALGKAQILETWSGKRPRPEGKAAPIIEQLPGYNNILLATGHYRNGILLAPATAQIIREMIREITL